MGINPELLKIARKHVGQYKQAFVPAGDPTMGGDPAAAGGAPPMDPAAAGGAPPVDPAAAGGAGAAGGGGEDPMAMIQPMIQQAVQQAMATQGGGGAGGAGGEGAIKPKIDVNVEIMQMKKMLAKIVDALGIKVPAQEMVATPEDLTQMAEGGPGYAAMTPDGGGADAGGGAMGQIQPMEPMKAAQEEEWEQGVAFTPPPAYDFQNAHATTRSTADLATAMIMRNRSGVA